MELVIEEPLKDSIFYHNLRFDHQYGDAKQWIKFRRANLKSTQIFWLTLRIVYWKDAETLYNPKCHVMVVLN